jgi:hypothetical protein
MGQVARCVEEDVPAVADLHNRVFFRSREESSEGLRSYYREMFFRTPWYQEDLPSLVYRVGDKVKGFLGCVPRRMEIDGQAVRVVILHRFMVAPDVGSPLAAMELIQEGLAGRQDLTVADGANDSGRKILEWSGATMSPLYSLNWLRPLRPCTFSVEMIVKRQRRLAPLGVAGRPVAKVVDALLVRLPSTPFSLSEPTTSNVDIHSELLLTGIQQFSKHYLLRPIYDLASLEWLLGTLRANTHRGRFGGMGIYQESQFIGLCLYYLTTTRVVEIMLLAAREDARDAVLHHVMYAARQLGGIGLSGRLEPKFLTSFADHNCLMKCGDWAFFHAKSRDLIDIINGGDAFLSPLEGELWLRSPMDRL